MAHADASTRGDDVVEVGGGSGVVEVVHALEVEPELGSGSQGPGDSECGIGGDAAAAVNDVADANLGDSDGLGESVLGDVQFFEELGEVFSGVNGLRFAR